MFGKLCPYRERSLPLPHKEAPLSLTLHTALAFPPGCSHLPPGNRLTNHRLPHQHSPASASSALPGFPPPGFCLISTPGFPPPGFCLISTPRLPAQRFKLTNRCPPPRLSQLPHSLSPSAPYKRTLLR